MRRVMLFAGVTLMLTGGPAGSSFMDEGTCKRGPTMYAFDLADHINAVSTRLVACVNYINDQEIENHNAQQVLLRELAQQIASLEARVSDLERR